MHLRFLKLQNHKCNVSNVILFFCNREYNKFICHLVISFNLKELLFKIYILHTNPGKTKMFLKLRLSLTILSSYITINQDQE